jgi:hypothetical protein
MTVREHDRHALLPDLVEVRRNCELRSCRLCWWGPRAHREGPGDSRLVHIFVPAIRRWLQHCHLLAPQRRLPGELAPLLLPRSISVEGEDQLTHLPRPVPAPALHTEDGHHARYASREQRQRIKRPFAYPQRSGVSLQRHRIEVAFHARQMVVACGLRDLRMRPHCRAVQVHQAPVRRGMGKDHAAPAPVAGGMRLGARRRIAHAVLLGQGQGNAPLLQVRRATTVRQGALECHELLGEV